MFSYDLEGIGLRIKTARLKNKLKQVDLFPEIKGGPAYISRWESGNVIPTVPLLLRLCKVLNMSVNEILGVKDEDVIEINRGSLEFKLLHTIQYLPESSKNLLTTIMEEMEKDTTGFNEFLANAMEENKQGRLNLDFFQTFFALPQESKDFLMAVAKRESRQCPNDPATVVEK